MNKNEKKNQQNQFDFSKNFEVRDQGYNLAKLRSCILDQIVQMMHLE